MAISYKKLWGVLAKKNIKRAELRKNVGIAPNTMTKIYGDEQINLGILCKICDYLQCDMKDIMDYSPEKIR